VSTIFGEIFGPTTGGGAVETTPPTITVVSPTPGVDPGAPGGFSSDWAIARLTPIIVRITDAGSGNRYQCLVCSYAGDAIERTVYRRGAFRGEYFGPSTETAIANGIELSIIPVGGWPSSDAIADITWEIDALDQAGNLAA
jgi:hypothetical protein